MKKRQPSAVSSSLKTKLFQMRLDAGEKQAFNDAAKIAGLSLSAWVRERLRRAAIRELEDANRKIAFLSNIDSY